MISMPDYRFEVALSFPGKYRQRIKKIAGILATKLGRERVLYDKFFEAELPTSTYLKDAPLTFARVARIDENEKHFAENSWLRTWHFIRSAAIGLFEHLWRSIIGTRCDWLPTVNNELLGSSNRSAIAGNADLESGTL
jgi:hypothetical protein